jgi:hypothetical protein
MTMFQYIKLSFELNPVSTVLAGFGLACIAIQLGGMFLGIF